MIESSAHDNSPAARLVPGPWLHRFSVLLAVLTLFLIVAGAMVTSTGSGLAVPDWPTTYEQNMFTFPYSKWVGGIFYEHGHRLIASTVGFLTIVMAVWLQRFEDRRWLRRLGWLALLLVILQGVLGGITVLYLLPTPVSVFHGCLAQAFFCTIVSIAVFTSPWWRRAHPVESEGRYSAHALAAAMTLVVFAQLVLGAIMRHTESGLAVPDFPRAYGQWLPSVSADAVESYNHERRWVLQLPQITMAQLAFHLAHRGGAIVVAIVLVGVCLSILRRHPALAALRVPAMLILLLLVVQIGLGAWTIWSQKAPVIASAHVAVGASILGLSWLMTIVAWRGLRHTTMARLPANAWVQTA